MLSDAQKKTILRGFIDYKIKHGAVKVIREVSPRQGYYIDDKFYLDSEIVRPFLDAYGKVKGNK